MTAYFLRRLVLIIPTFLGITVMVFTITRFVPGGPMDKLMMRGAAQQEGQSSGGGGPNMDGGLSEADKQAFKEYYGADKGTIESYFLWLGKIVRLDLGTSLRYTEPVWDIIKDKFPVSVYYGLLSMILTYLVSIPLGVVKAIKHASFIDNASSILIFIGYAIPGFVFGIFMLVVFAANLEMFPLGGFTSDNFSDFTLWEKMKDLLDHTILPLSAYLVGSFAVMTLIMKNSLMENLAADYVRTAIAKGVTFKKAVFKHALRNSLIPLATHFGNNLSLILTGSFLIETIFNIDGLGLLGYESLLERDYPVVMGTLVISSLLFMIGNILSDICVMLVDPRVKFD